MSATVRFLPCTHLPTGSPRRTALLAAAVVAGLASAASGQLSTWTGPTSGNWSAGGNWNNGVPTGGAMTALVDGGNAQNTTVTSDVTRSIGTLLISGGDQVNLANNTTLDITTLLNNLGTLAVNSSGNNTFLSTGGGSLAVTGGGAIQLNGGNSSLAFLATSGTFNNTDNTITGQGVIGNNSGFFINGGTVNANVSGSAIYIDPSSAGMTNSGVLTSSNGGTLRMNGAFTGGLTNTGTVSAQDGSVTQFENSFSVSGGTFTTSGTGVVKTADGNTVHYASINNLGNWTLGNSSTSNYTGNLFNSGSINLTAGANNVQLNFNAGTTNLTGGGTVNLNAPAGGTNFFHNGGGRLVNVNNTIRGTGIIANNGGQFTNGPAGVVSADLAGLAILCDPQSGADTFVNQGVMRAVNGGLLQFTGAFSGGVTNTGGTLSASGAGSEVQFYNSISITGGTFAASAGGVIRTVAGQTAFFNSIASTGDWILDNNSTNNLTGSLFNSGTILLAPSANNVQLNFNSGTVVLNGGGTIVLQPGAGGTAFLQNGNGRLVNVNNTLRGAGILANNGGQFTNEIAGVVSADVSGAALFCDPQAVPDGFVNHGLMRATGGGILQFTGQFGGSVTNNGTITALAGSEVQMFNSNLVVGGTISSAGTGVIRVNDGHSASVQGVTLAGNVVVGNNSTLNFNPGTITNTGSININAGTGNSSLNAAVGGSTVTLTGGGTVNLANATGTLTGAALINGSGTLVNQNNTIRGAGNLAANNLAVVNNGTVSADLSGQALFVDPQAAGGTIDFTNSGTMQAANGGILQLTGQFGGQVNNAAGRIIANHGSNVQLFNSSSVIGGTFSTVGTGTISVIAGQAASITNVTNNGALVINGSAANLTAAGVFTNNGTLTLLADAASARFNAGGSLSLAGSGAVLLNDGPGGRSIFGDAGGTIVIGASQTVRGAGNVASNNVAIVNNGTIAADQNGRSIFVDPVATAGGFVNNGLMAATNGGILQFTGQFGGAVTNNGTLSAGTAAVVQYFSSNAVTGGTLTSTGTGAHEVAPGQAVFFANNTNTGTINVQGGGANYNGSGTLLNNGTIALLPAASSSRFNSNSGSYVITGSGTILMNPAATAGTAVLGDAGNTIDLGPSITVRGRGTVAANNTAIVNRGLVAAAGGAEIFVDPVAAANGFQNLGTLRVETGSQMRFSGQSGGGVNNSGGWIDVQAGGTLRTESSHSMSGGTVTLAGTWNADSSSNTDLLNFRGAGTLNISNSARVGLIAGGGTVGTGRVGSLSIASNGKLDLTDHDFVIDYTGASPLATVRTLIQSGFNAGAWTGAGITSDNARVAAATPDKTGVGYAEATDLGSPASFGGLPVDATSVLHRYTLLGDANLDRIVNIADFSRLGANFNTAGPWFNGDFNYDGQVGIGDFSLLASNYNKSVPAAMPSRGGAVPEPAALGVLVAAGAVGVARRRRG